MSRYESLNLITIFILVHKSISEVSLQFSGLAIWPRLPDKRMTRKQWLMDGRTSRGVALLPSHVYYAHRTKFSEAQRQDETPYLTRLDGLQIISPISPVSSFKTICHHDIKTHDALLRRSKVA